MFFCDPDTGEWHELRWRGLQPDDEVPSFSSATAEELLRQARQRGISPHSDIQMLPVLLELIGTHVPVEQWPTQMTKQQRTGHARQTVQGDSAHADRPKPARHPTESADETADEAAVVPLRWPDQARRVEQAVDTERRRRREAIIGQRPKPAPLLGESLRRRNLFLLPDDEDDGPTPAWAGAVCDN